MFQQCTPLARLEPVPGPVPVGPIWRPLRVWADKVPCEIHSKNCWHNHHHQRGQQTLRPPVNWQWYICGGSCFFCFGVLPARSTSFRKHLEGGFHSLTEFWKLTGWMATPSYGETNLEFRLNAILLHVSIWEIIHRGGHGVLQDASQHSGPTLVRCSFPFMGDG